MDQPYRVHFTKVTLEYFEVEVDITPSGSSTEFSAEQMAKSKLKKDPKRHQLGANNVAWITTGVRAL